MSLCSSTYLPFPDDAIAIRSEMATRVMDAVLDGERDEEMLKAVALDVGRENVASLAL